LRHCEFLIAYVDGWVWDMKPRYTRRFWVRSTKSITLWLMITCILFLQGYSESSLPWARRGCAVQIAFFSSRGRSVPSAASHTDTCAYGSRPNAASCNECPVAFLIKQVRKRLQCFTLLAYSLLFFPNIPECFQRGPTCSRCFLSFFVWDDNYIRSSAVFPVFLAAYVYLANTEMFSQTSIYHISYTFVANAFCTCCILRCLVCIVVSCLVCIVVVVFVYCC